MRQSSQEQLHGVSAGRAARPFAAAITIVALSLVLMAVGGGRAGGAGSGAWTWPVSSGHRIVDGFDPPSTRFGAGHRGVDLAGTAGEPVRAVAAGTVTHAGRIGGVWTVTVTHGAERSTYQPVRASVRVGEAVTAGQRIGTLLATGSHCATTCLHLGRLRGTTYLDPAELLTSAGSFRLISPDGAPPTPPSWSGSTSALHGGSGLVNLLGGRVTSPYGMRKHPITGIWKLHDGVDIGAACGTRVPAFAAGTVTFAGAKGAYGNQVQVRHDGRHATSYSHLSVIGVHVGQRLAKGAVVGLVGSTGSSTGCHLHFMSIVDGHPVNPMG